MGLDFTKSNTGIVSAKSERIGDGYVCLIFTGLEWGIVKVAFRIRLLETDGRRDDAVTQRKSAGDDLHGTGCTEHVAGHGFCRADDSLARLFFAVHVLGDLEGQHLLGFVDLVSGQRAETAHLIQKYPLIPCNDCKYCMPCPYGIDIPAVLTYYNKRVTESSLPTDRESPDYRRVRRSFLDEYDRAVPSLRQADHCIGCRTCVEECPQKIDIPQQLRRIDEYVEKLKQNTL